MTLKNPSEARDAWKHYDERAQANDNEEQEDGNSTGAQGEQDDSNEGTGDGDEDAQDGVDQYQPASGDEGSFCPNSVEYCRRGRERAEASGGTILTGMVLVNPGDPLVPVNGPRLIFDPQDLVINPDPAVAESAGGTSRNTRFQMIIPVLVNPPGPNDPGAMPRIENK